MNQLTQMRLGSEVAPSQLKRRGSASMIDCPIRAWPGQLRENDPNTVPSRGAWLCSQFAATMLPAAGMFCTMMSGWPGMCRAMYLASTRPPTS